MMPLDIYSTENWAQHHESHISMGYFNRSVGYVLGPLKLRVLFSSTKLLVVFPPLSFFLIEHDRSNKKKTSEKHLNTRDFLGSRDLWGWRLFRPTLQVRGVWWIDAGPGVVTVDLNRLSEDTAGEFYAQDGSLAKTSM